MKAAARHDLAGKLHVTVGESDTFYLNGAVEKLQRELQQLVISADVQILPGKNHNDLYGTRDDPLALLKGFSRTMYQIARPSPVQGRDPKSP